MTRCGLRAGWLRQPCRALRARQTPPKAARAPKVGWLQLCVVGGSTASRWCDVAVRVGVKCV